MSAAYSLFSLDGNHPADLPDGRKATQPAGPSPAEACQVRREHQIRKGLWLSEIDCRPTQPMVLRYARQKPMANFGFILSGTITNHLQCPRQGRVALTNKAGTCGILCTEQQCGKVVIPPQRRLRVLHVHLCPRVFTDLFQRDAKSLPAALRGVLDGSSPWSYRFRGGISPSMQSVLHRIEEGPPHGVPRHLYFEGLACELMAHQVASAKAEGCIASAGCLSQPDRERIAAAAEMLTRDLAEPPTLQALARAVGMGVNKLQSGFQALYGLSVFRYLAACKMQKARRLFRETDLNVSETAWALGYTNVSHFSAAYKKAYGTLPKKHIQELRSQSVSSMPLQA